MISSISWKNVWRNKLRSLVVIIAVTFGLIAGVFVSGLMNGFVERRIRAAIYNETSHIQIHHPKFLENKEMQYGIKEADSILESLRKDSRVRAVAKRMKMTAMISTASAGTGALIIGIDPENEKAVSSIHTFIPDSLGTYFDADKKNQIVISRKTAERLKARVRSKIVLTFQSLDGTLTGGAFRVAGIYKTSNTVFDEMNLFVRYDDLAGLTGFQVTEAHEIAVLLNETRETGAVADKIKSDYPELDVIDWMEISPDVGMIAEFLNIWLYFFVVIILLALGFGIINTMLMVVLERVKELGMLMAVGMNKWRIFKMIMLETVYLTFTGGVTGMLLGAAIIWITGKTGLDFSQYGEGFEAIGYESVVYPTIGIEYFAGVTILVLITGMLASLYPARKALKINPAEAIRTDI